MDGARYERQVLLPEIGRHGLEKLSASSVFVVGCGGLGSTLLYDLCGIGVGRIGFCDGDVVALSNLNRQFLHTPADLGRSKAASAYEKLRAFAPELRLEAHDVCMSEENASGMLRGYDLVLLAVDSIPARLIANRACVAAQIPLVDAGIDGLNGSVYTFRPDKTACLGCLYQDLDQPRTIPIPSFAPVVSAVASLEALSAANILLGLPNPTDGRILLFDGTHMTTEFVALARNPICPVCS